MQETTSTPKPEKKYKQVGAMSFDVRTPDQVCEILARLNQTRERVKIRWGNTETGEDWNDEFDTIGEIGRSTGTYKIPLLIHNSRSMGGGAILDHCLLKITRVSDKKVLYVHPKYQERTIEIKPLEGTPEYLPEHPEYTLGTYINGKLHGRHKSMQSAKICVNRLT